MCTTTTGDGSSTTTTTTTNTSNDPTAKPSTASNASSSSKKKGKASVATEISEAMRAFPAYDDGSIFVVMQYFAKLEERMLASDMARFKQLLGALNVDVATLTPQERCRQVEGTRAEIRELLQFYGQDLIDELPQFERSAANMTKGANIFHK
jgi:hypothetical protein